MKSNWILKPIESIEGQNLPKLSAYPTLISRLLLQRGLREEREIQEFLHPDYGNLQDPFLFRDMQQAVGRIQQAITRQEKVCVYADYDADAITAAAVVYLGLEKLGLTADCYIPDRFSEGYGLNLDAIKQLAAAGTKLILTVDCGTNAIAEAKLAQELGVDLIITDHHEITDGLPEALALLNPKNRQDNYPFQYLTGVGVAFKLIQALFLRITNHESRITEGYEKWLLDLVAIGTVADLQPLTSENRLLVHFGLQVLSKTRWPGLRALLKVSGLEGSGRPLDTYTLGFLLAPRLNAAGRIKHGKLAFQLLIAEDQGEALKLVEELNELNAQRQVLTEQILSEARAQVETDLDKKILLAAHDNWPKGVMGLVAGKLTEEFSRPSLVIEKNGEWATGSARSVNGFNMIEALLAAHDLLQKYGGHAQAAGFTLASHKIPQLHQRLSEYADKIDYQPQPVQIKIDSEVSARDLTWEIFGYLSKFAPFGFGNPKPRFLGRNLWLLSARMVGSDNQHLKLRCRFGEKEFNAIAFGKGFLNGILNSHQPFDAVFELESNEWNRHRQLQLKIVDIKL